MDGYIHDDIMNFDLTNSILCHRGELSRRYKSPQVTLKPFKDQIKQKLQHLNATEIEELREELVAKQQS